jgi:hypothetical protein
VAGLVWAVLMLSIVSDANSLLVLFALAIGVVTAHQWFKEQPGTLGPTQIITTIAAGLAAGLSTYVLNLLVIFAVVPAIAIGIGKVKRDDEEADHWAKIRPCIALPGFESRVDGAPALDYHPDLPGKWFKSGYPALICTAQVKRSSDDRYLEVRPFPGDTNRNFARLDDTHFVTKPRTQAEKSTLLSMLYQRQLDCFVVLEQLASLLNLEDRRRIAEALRNPSTMTPRIDVPQNDLPRTDIPQPDVAAPAPAPAWAPPPAPLQDDPEALRDMFGVTLHALGDLRQLWARLMPNGYARLRRGLANSTSWWWSTWYPGRRVEWPGEHGIRGR